MTRLRNNSRRDHRVRGPTFREQALDAIDRVNWIPDWGKNRIEGAVKSRPDWCISRQRTWGVPIPAFYDAKGNAILDAQIVRNTADLIEKHGSNVWFEKSAAELVGARETRRIGRALNPSPNPTTRWMSGLIPARPRAPS